VLPLRWFGSQMFFTRRKAMARVRPTPKLAVFYCWGCSKPHLARKAVCWRGKVFCSEECRETYQQSREAGYVKT